MIDLHSHIIPGIDDGAASMRDALEMARQAVRGGTAVIAATSHGDFSHGDPGGYLKEYNEKLAMLRRALAEHAVPLRVVSGMELLVSEKLIAYGKKHTLPSLNGGPYLLTEFWFDASGRFIRKNLERLAEMGWKIVLAHPERYDCMQNNPELLFELYEKGVVLQVNRGSLLNELGRRACSLAQSMVRKGIAGAGASGAHDPVLRRADMEAGAEVLETFYGRSAAVFLTEKNPERILKSGNRGSR